MGNTPTIRELKILSDDELVRRHDAQADRTAVGTQYYLDEIKSRQQDRLNQAIFELTQKMHYMTVITTIATVLALIVSVASLIISLWK